MALTNELGTSNSSLANIELGLGGAVYVSPAATVTTTTFPDVQVVQSGLSLEYLSDGIQVVQSGTIIEYEGAQAFDVSQSGTEIEFVNVGLEAMIVQNLLLIEYALPFPPPAPAPNPASTASIGGSGSHGIGLSIPGGGISIRFGRGYGALPKEA